MVKFFGAAAVGIIAYLILNLSTFSNDNMVSPCIRVAQNVKAAPSTIWNACIGPMNWEQWDEDIVRLEPPKSSKQTSGGTPPQRLELEVGKSFTFIMKDSSVKEIPVTLLQVKPNDVIEYKGGAMYGLLKVWGKIEIETEEGEDVAANNTSTIKYSFELSGMLGSLAMWKDPKPVVHGTETGLANIVRLAEEKQQELSTAKNTSSS